MKTKLQKLQDCANAGDDSAWGVSSDDTSELTYDGLTQDELMEAGTTWNKIAKHDELSTTCMKNFDRMKVKMMYLKLCAHSGYDGAWGVSSDNTAELTFFWLTRRELEEVGMTRNKISKTTNHPKRLMIERQ